MHSLMVGIFDPVCELLPPWMRNYTCVLLPFYLLSDLLPPPPLPKLNVLLIPVANLPLVSTIPAANFPPVSTTPVVNCKFIYMLTLLPKVVQKKS